MWTLADFYGKKLLKPHKPQFNQSVQKPHPHPGEPSVKSVRAAVIILLILGTIATGTLPSVGSVTWSTPSVVPTPTGLHLDPSATQDLQQSNIWLFWSSVRVPVHSEIYYMKYNPSFGTWQSEIPVTQNSEDDNSPAVTTLNNGTMLLFWSARRAAVGQSLDIYTKRLTGGIWSPEAQLTTSTLDDEKPAVLQDRAGKVWVAWNRNVTGNIDLFYNVYQNGLWQGETRLTSTVGEDKLAALAQTKDGRIWMVWTARGTQAVTFIRYATYNGTAWSPPATLAQSRDGDIDPSIVQDRSGTIWVVWTRFIKVGNSYLGDLYYTNSSDNGATWPTSLPFFSTSSIDELQPSIRQFNDNRLWIFYSVLDETANTFNLNFIKSSPILSIHDLRMDSLTASPANQIVGGTVTLTASYTNIGDSLETAARLIIKANSTVLSDTTNTIRVGETREFSFNWNTQGFSPGAYLLTASVTIVGETVGNSQDNTVTIMLLVFKTPDLNGDGTVNIVDLAQVGAAFGAVPSSPNWNARADLNFDGQVNIIDLAVVAASFGRTL